MHQNLDARLEQIVAPPPAIVDPHHRLQIGKQFVAAHKFVQAFAQKGRAPLPAAGKHLIADCAAALLYRNADIMHRNRGAVARMAGDGNLELARQVGKLGMETGPLAYRLRQGAGVFHLAVNRGRIRVRRHIANAIARGLNRMHFHGGEIAQNRRHLRQFRPIILDVLAGGEMPIAAVIAARNLRQHAHLAARQRAIGYRHPQHIGVQLQIEPIHQPQRLELLFAQLAFDAALHLAGKLLHPLAHQLMVKLIIAIHARALYFGGR